MLPSWFRSFVSAFLDACYGYSYSFLLCTYRHFSLTHSLSKVTSVQILHTDDLCKGDDVFFAATGVSDGDLLNGVRYSADGATSNSLVMRCSSGTVRYIETHHRWDKCSITNVPEGSQLKTQSSVLAH